MPVSVGIDLGTTNSCIAAWKDGAVEIIANDMGLRSTPSWVSFVGAECLVGEAAKEKPENAVFDMKRLVGRKFVDPFVQANLKRWPFKVSSEDDGRATIAVSIQGEKKLFRPEQISSMIVLKMKEWLRPSWRRR
eukprot:SRR837773.22373.p2 GENE.SRR837773.22373~~SRR837773.22373.p2  ORF type:complete len:134 (+),score=39.60 SRR837773.22373:46-447(+)